MTLLSKAVAYSRSEGEPRWRLAPGEPRIMQLYFSVPYAAATVAHLILMVGVKTFVNKGVTGESSND